MQDHYLPRREERFDEIVRIIRETQSDVARILDLGCGPGNLSVRLLDAFPQATVIGVDFDPALLVLARERLAACGERAVLLAGDLRADTWAKGVPAPVDAVVSSTALHWLAAEQLDRLYRAVARILRPDGVLLNADHVGSDIRPLQLAWEAERRELRRACGPQTGDDWAGFWEAYGEALGGELVGLHDAVMRDWGEGGIEEGLPLAWHFERLTAHGFHSIDCFWRCAGDAVYGGLR